MDVTTANAEMEDADIALAIRLMQQDAQELVSTITRRGKQVEGSQTDAQIAANLFLQDLMVAETSFDDRRMARSIVQAIQTDTDAVSRLQNEEHMAQADRTMSLALINGEHAAGVPQTSQKSVCWDTDEDTYVLDQPESSTWAASRPSKQSRPRPCNACGDEKHFVELARAPCGHEYCRECLTRIFQNATNDESLFPPRCCKESIPLDKNLTFLDDCVIQNFREKSIEFTTSRRTYCHNPRCSQFIPPTNYADDTASCSRCGQQTCMTCKGASHHGDCPNDESLHQVLQLAGQQLWQRCQNCRAMIELNVGCNHITCRCGHQFCYVCGALWRTCRCDHWTEARLLERAAEINARDDADAGAAPAPPPQPVPDVQPDIQPDAQQPPRDEVERIGRPRVEALPGLDIDEFFENMRQLVENLRIDHECEHRQWKSRTGGYACEECGDHMPVFIYECRQCHKMTCRRCRYHRL
ncbi:hypothetical protein GGS26DRAFT_585914 [Hypomontagnella submonticulosa]|nr:hypothetical protein GGS26DRAFT_585914 [Hypomontagnella submonticulosa]